MRAGELAEHIEHFRGRVLAESLQAATAIFWTRRAVAFEWAMPRPDDYFGKATPAEVEAQRQRLAAIAEACRQRAAVSILGGEVA